MSRMVETLAELDQALGDLVRESYETGAQRSLSDDEVLTITALAGRIVRHGEALAIDATAQIQERCEYSSHDERVTTRKGARSVSELLQRATLASKQTVAGYERAARATCRRMALSSGQELPADYPALREALAGGHIGADGLSAVLGPLSGVLGDLGRAGHLAADEEIAASARGQGVDAAPPACAEELRLLAQVWSVYLDQDGAEPREAAALRRRGITLGAGRDSLVPVRGHLLPEVAAQLERLFDSSLTPKLSGPRFTDSDEPSEVSADDRTRAQRQHDVLANALDVAARSGEFPTIGGAAPTLVVSVREEDLVTGRGYAQVEGSDQPVSIGAARHVACTGGVLRVTLDKGGRIVALNTLDRVFNHHQRKGITLRDGGCIIPGCHIPASWCEIHHVAEHAHGGPTHTDNGVLLCWFHHRTLDSSGWRIRMNHGVPEVRGPSWWDSRMLWRPVTTSRVRLRERLERRQ
ncbi:HNH endonuclease signature motif containing protein [Microbacterium sp.]|uniref:HNH endonuclease signature motif containing protein n=1 Tax=Microbacterium sp. TaxID=51671 RepID=UPI002E359750|nr:DUF222 domain-containing protein [Microbacterium sp.]HEX5730118.1 DUF222 domain-containing protein [Microbacterium sp.]